MACAAVATHMLATDGPSGVSACGMSRVQPVPEQSRDDDRALVEAVLAGAPGAFERLVRQYQGLCWHIVQRMVRHPEDARELCQETFLRVHQCLHQYRFDAALKSWIGQVAYSMAKRHLERRRIPLAETAQDDDGLSLAESVGDGFDLEATSADAQVSAHLHAAIEALPPLQRTVLTLYHLEEMPIGEISRVTGLAEGTIKSHLFRSRKQLRALLEPRIGVAA
ncbi:RNA polymerase sigma-70 factor (ECF subfamily) [Luteimonas cucumeris]|uniref:RNA polymerase sigma-70 factor (ECF subfamily) n=1 Tax=Luteimonas cucumeris TaxID=985012 RepID=A0A562LEM8_9GAMM|nr:RNA polymerase sigma-70 factor (ECF subfamily) [Luteimonas cucumeris]